MRTRALMPHLGYACLVLLLASPGCQWFVNQADQDVYRLIEKRQMQALGENHSAHIDKEQVPSHVSHDAYSFVPNPLDPSVPPAFLTASQPASEADGAIVNTTSEPAAPSAAAISDATQPSAASESIEAGPATQTAESVSHEIASRPASMPAVDKSNPILTLSQGLAYAYKQSREFQSAKEDLYLAALSLTLERHLWTPQFTGNIGTQYANYGEVRNFDHAMAAVAQVGVEQRLPLGGTVTAKVIDNLMRDLTHHVTTGETGQAVLAANIPLLKGAGLVAYESRFQAERNMIYAVRAFENFRRDLSVQIAGDYFNLQQLRQAILNARDSTESLRWLAARARARYRMGRVLLLEAQRAEQGVAFAEIEEINATESYRTALDRFKLRIGMPTQTPIDVPLPTEPGAATQPEEDSGESRELEAALFIPAVSQEIAIDTALKYRLDLLNDFDRIDDSARGVKVAENNLLPDLSASGSVAWDTNPNRLGTWKYGEDRATWRAGLNLELPLDEFPERNALRSSLIRKRKSERDYQAAHDTVILQVRRDIRTIEQQRISLQIQTRNRDLALFRRKGAQIQFLKSRVNILEVTDAEAALLDSRNRLAQAQAELLLAILQFRRDTGTLRIDDEGRWTGASMSAVLPIATTQPNG